MQLSLKEFATLIKLSTLTLIGVTIPNQAYTLDAPGSAVPVAVKIESKPNLVKASGIVFSSRSSFEVKDTSIKKIGDKLYEISYEVPRNRVDPDSVASAVATDENGVEVFSNVTPALTSAAKDLVASVPECPGEDTSTAVTISTPGALRQLVDVRSERMEIVRQKLRRAMENGIKEKLNRLESAFGLSRAGELNAELAPAELIDRLGRIKFALKKYQSAKAAQ
jgi:hypothetical protein